MCGRNRRKLGQVVMGVLAHHICYSSPCKFRDSHGWVDTDMCWWCRIIHRYLWCCSMARTHFVSSTLGAMGRNRYACACRCGVCRRTPGSRRVECVCCGYLVGPGCCLSVEGGGSQRNLQICHVCGDNGVHSWIDGLYAHWCLGEIWRAYICFAVLLSLSLEFNGEPDTEPDPDAEPRVSWR